MSVNVAFAESKGKATPFTYNGQVVLKDVAITLPNEPYLENLNSVIYLAGNSVRVPSATFQSFDGSGLAGVTVTLGAVPAYSHLFRLKDVNGQKAINASVDAYVTQSPENFKDKIYGTMNLAYAGLGKGFSGDAMMASQVGGGSYTIEKSRVKGFAVIKSINQYFKDNSDEIDFEQIAGNLSMRNKVFTYTANTTGQVGTIRETGAINVVEMAYAPDMKIQCDIKKQFLNSDSLLSGVPGEVKGLVKNGDWIADDNGNVPIDIKFSGPVKQNNWSYDWGRLTQNVKNKLGKELQNAAGDTIQQKAQDLGNQLKGLFH